MRNSNSHPARRKPYDDNPQKIHREGEGDKDGAPGAGNSQHRNPNLARKRRGDHKRTAERNKKAEDPQMKNVFPPPFPRLRNEVRKIPKNVVAQKFKNNEVPNGGARGARKRDREKGRLRRKFSQNRHSRKHGKYGGEKNSREERAKEKKIPECAECLLQNAACHKIHGKENTRRDNANIASHAQTMFLERCHGIISIFLREGLQDAEFKRTNP